MITPKLRFKEFVEPWISRKMEDICKINQGLQIPINKRYFEAGHRRHLYITNEFLKPNSKYSYFIETEQQSVMCDENDVLMTRTGNTGQVVTGVNGVFHNNFFKIVYKKEKINQHFLVNFLRKKSTQKLILSLAGASTIPDLNHKDFYQIPIVFPKLDEQKKIAAFLSLVDQKITLLTQKNELLTQYKKGVMQKIFNQEVRFKDEAGNDYPDWESKTISELCECLDSKRKPLNETERQLMKGDIPYWGANNIMDYVNDFIFDETIVLLAEDGGNFNEYQSRPIANISFGKSWVNNHTHVLRGKPKILNEFLFYSLVHKNITAYVTGGTRSKLTKNAMLKIKIDLPSLSEQRKIASFLSALDNKIGSIQKQFDLTKQYKQGLLQQMFI